MNKIDLEVKILSNLHMVKQTLKSICICYQEDFLLENIVFITIDDNSKLKGILQYIEISEEQFATH